LTQLEKTNVVTHRIDTGNAREIKQLLTACPLSTKLL